MFFAKGVLIEKQLSYLFARLKSMRANTATRLIALAAVLVAVCSTFSYGQAIGAEIRVDAKTNSIEVAGRFLDGGEIRNIAFEREFAGVSGLAERISQMRTLGANGKEVTSKAFAPGEFAAAESIGAFSYTIRLDAPDRTGQAHVSWLKNGRGVLFLGDILPLVLGKASTSATVRIIDQKVGVAGGCSSLAEGKYECSDRASAVFALSPDLRTVKTAETELNLLIEGAWNFDDQAAAKEAAELFGTYREVFGGSPQGPFEVVVMKFADETPPGRFEADTRGRTIVILSSDAPFKSQSMQRLSLQLRHELFHLWLPNGVALAGRYDWFYEGAALYMASRVGLKTNRIRFDDLVSQLSTAIAFDRTSPKGVSLVMAADTRWQGNATKLYARGMLAAFMLDLELLKRSKTKHSLEDVLRKLFSTHDRRKASKVDADPAIIEAFSAFNGTGTFAKELVDRTEPLNVAAALENSGFELADSGRGLKVKENPSSREKAILNKLGYNNWRKLSR